MTVTSHQAWTGRVNGGPPRAVVLLPRQRPVETSATAPPGTLADQRRKLAELSRRVQPIPQMEDSISTLEDQLRYLDGVVAIPAPASTGHPEQPVRDITSGTPAETSCSSCGRSRRGP